MPKGEPAFSYLPALSVCRFLSATPVVVSEEQEHGAREPKDHTRQKDSGMDVHTPDDGVEAVEHPGDERPSEPGALNGFRAEVEIEFLHIVQHFALRKNVSMFCLRFWRFCKLLGNRTKLHLCLPRAPDDVEANGGEAYEAA